MNEDRLNRQIAFLVELDKLKTVFRNAFLVADPDRRENSAKHSWHTAMMAAILEEYSEHAVDSLRVIKMMLLHDVIELDAGDTDIYDGRAAVDKASREERGAERVFSLLPSDQHQEMQSLWAEFEGARTPEARFAQALDRIMPLIHNYYTHGKRWKEDGITYEMALPVYQVIQEYCPALWGFAGQLLDESVTRGYLPEHL